MVFALAWLPRTVAEYSKAGAPKGARALLSKGLLSARSASFPRTARLTTRSEYQRVFEQARRSTDPCFTVLWRSNVLGLPRLGLAISKKHVKLATQRNRLKRLVREYFRLHQGDLPPMDFVVLARPGLATRTNAEIWASLRRHRKRLLESCNAS